VRRYRSTRWCPVLLEAVEAKWRPTCNAAEMSSGPGASAQGKVVTFGPVAANYEPPRSDHSSSAVELPSNRGLMSDNPGITWPAKALRRFLLVLMPGLLTAMPLTPTPAVAGPLASPSLPGYWLAGADGGIFAFNAPFYGSGALHPGAPGPCAVVAGQITGNGSQRSNLSNGLGCNAVAAIPNGLGYWLLNAYNQGIGPFPASLFPPPNGCTSLNGATGIWTGIASSTTGAGFWAVSSNGAVLGCGDVPPPYGGLASVPLNALVVGMAPTPDGKGYWLVAADGGIFTFGDAGFYGSTGSEHLNAPIVGIATTPDGKGYWLTSADGGVFSFGDAPFAGSVGGSHLNAPVVGIAATPDGKGYWLAAADGGVFSFGSAPFHGSMAGTVLAGPIIGMATYRGSAAG
jgi:hypothetical protein